MLNSARQPRDGRSFWTRHAQRDRGATVVITALLLTVLVGSVSFAIDLGTQMGVRRDLQTAADVIALDLVRLADGRTLGEIHSAVRASTDPNPGANHYESELARSADDNRVVLDEIVTDRYGVWDDNALTFTPLDRTVPADLAVVPNAIEIRIRRTVDYAFRPGSGDTSRSAIAYQAPAAQASLGTKLVQASPCIFEGGTDSAPCNIDEADREELNLLLELLSGVAGVDIAAGSYAGLVSANVTLGDLAVAAGFGTVDEFLDAELTMTDVAEASAQAMSNDGDAVRAGYFGELVQLSEEREERYFGTPAVPGPEEVGFVPRELYDIDTQNGESVADIVVNLFDFYAATLQASNRANLLTTCTGTTDPVEVEAAHDGVDDPDDGANALVEPADFGPVAIISDSVCMDVVSARKIGFGRVGDAPLLKEQFRTAQLAATHTVLMRFGDPDTNVPLQSSEPCDLIADNGVADCSLLPPPPAVCDAIAGNFAATGLGDCIASLGDPCDRTPTAPNDLDDGVATCPVPPPAECDAIAGNGIGDCANPLADGCQIIGNAADDGVPSCGTNIKNPSPCNVGISKINDGIPDCTAGLLEPCDANPITPVGISDTDDGASTCPAGTPPPCNITPADGIRDCIAVIGQTCDTSSSNPPIGDDDGIPECPSGSPIGCNETAGDGVADCVKTSVEGELPTIPTFTRGGLAIPIEGDLSLPIRVVSAGASSDVTNITCNELTNQQAIDADVYREPVSITVGNGPDTPIGTLTVSNPITGATSVVDVFIDKTYLTPASGPNSVSGLDVGDTASLDGGNPLDSLALTKQDVDVQVKSGVLPEGDPVADTLDPVTNEASALSAEVMEAIIASALGPIIEEYLVVPDAPSPPALPVGTIFDPLTELLDNIGFAIGTVDLTNVGFGTLVKDGDGNVTGYDVHCGLPRLVD